MAAQPVANEKGEENLHRTSTAAFYHAMVLHRRGLRAEAREVFRAAETKFTPPADGLRLPVGAPKHDPLILLLAHREAKALLGNPAPE